MIRRSALLTAALTACALALTSCGSTDEDADTVASTPGQSPTEAASPSNATGTATTAKSDAENEATTEDESKLEDDTETPDPSPSEGQASPTEHESNDEGPSGDISSSLDPEEFTQDGVTQEAEQGSDITDLGELVDIRVGVHDQYERLVIEFTGSEAPNSFSTEFTDDPMIRMTEEPLEIPGDSALYLRISNLYAGPFQDSPAGDDRLALEEQPVVLENSSIFTEVHYGGRIEALGEFYIGIDTERPVRVAALDDPSRIVFDVSTPYNLDQPDPPRPEPLLCPVTTSETRLNLCRAAPSLASTPSMSPSGQPSCAKAPDWRNATSHGSDPRCGTGSALQMTPPRLICC